MSTMATANIQDLGFTLEQIKKLDEQLRKMANYSKLQSIGLIEMANMTQKLKDFEQETRNGYVDNKRYVVLDTDFNGAKSYKIPDRYVFNPSQRVIVAFENNRIVNIRAESSVDVKQKPVSERVSQIPESGFWISKEQDKILQVASNAFNDDNNPHKGFVIALQGEAGNGKTSLAQNFAMRNNLPLLIIDCSTIADNGDWFLLPGFRNQETVFDKTKFTEFLIEGKCVILLDEVNRMPPAISNALLPILDHRRFTSVRGVDIKVNNKVAFFMTSNHGYAYTGTNPIDQALKGRTIGTIKVGNLPPDIETELLEKRIGIDYETSKTIVKVFVQLRDSELREYPINIATRTSLNVAWWCKYGLSIREAFTVGILNDINDDSAQKIILDALNTNNCF